MPSCAYERRVDVQRAHALRRHVGGEPQFVVLRLEYQVQGVEHRTGDVSMEGVRIQVQRIGVRKQFGERFRDALAVVAGNADVNGHGQVLALG